MEVNLSAVPRPALGSAASRRLRRQAKVPAILYGGDLDPVPVAVESNDLASVLHTEAGLNVLINLEVDGQSHLTLPRAVQRHPVRGQIVHVDFIKISLTEKVEGEIRVELVGEPVAVRESDAVVEHLRMVVRVEALPRDLPPHIDVDVSQLEVGDVLRVADLPRLGGVAYLDDPEESVATVAIPRLEVEEVEVEEAEGLEVSPEAEAAEEPTEGEA
ncbi:MAG: 50S ribosomal protein L25 [Actinomycetota bacterium]|nr:50S ribosomal protein L25 [Actinomycetota bacterium]